MPKPKTIPKVRIAIDLGASSGRVIAGTVSEEKLTLREIHRFGNPTVDLPNGLFWDIHGLFREILTGLQKSVEIYGDDIASIGIDTWGCDFGLFNSTGELIESPHQYRDPRFEGMAEKMHSMLPEVEIFGRTGIKTNFYNSSLHLLAMSLKNPNLLAEAHTLLFVPDILAYWLTGIKAVERTIASTSQLLNPRTGDWAIDIIEALGLPRKIFGKIVAPGAILGNLRHDLKETLGRRDIPLVVAPSHDTASAVAGIPISRDEALWLSSGTWSIMGVELRQPITTREALELGFCNELGIAGTVRFLKNIAGLWLIQECKRQWDLDGQEHSFAELAEMAASAEQFTAFIDPDIAVFAAPGNMPSKIRQYCEKTGQTVPDTFGQILRVATESLAMKYRIVYENILRLTGLDFTSLHAGGGGIQNEMLCQATANALGIDVIAGPVEATSCGNIITQMIATGEAADFASGRRLIRDSFRFTTYSPKDSEAWDKAYKTFLQIIS